MKVKNRPGEYVTRASLPGRSAHVQRNEVKSHPQPEERDFMSVEIDANFYFTFRSKPSREKP